MDNLVKNTLQVGSGRPAHALNFAQTKARMIATLFGKKKITEDKLANVFVNAVFELTAEGFPTIAAELNEAPEFEVPPELGPEDDRTFGLIVLAGNLLEIQRVAGPGLDRRIFSLGVSKYAQTFNLNCAELEDKVRSLQSLMSRLNSPSKNTVYAMSKAIFHEYDLFCFQDAYFREQRNPNPIILKRINTLMGYCLWNWSEVMDQYKVI